MNQLMLMSCYFFLNTIYAASAFALHEARKKEEETLSLFLGYVFFEDGSFRLVMYGRAGHEIDFSQRSMCM